MTEDKDLSSLRTTQYTLSGYGAARKGRCERRAILCMSLLRWAALALPIGGIGAAAAWTFSGDAPGQRAASLHLIPVRLARDVRAAASIALGQSMRCPARRLGPCSRRSQMHTAPFAALWQEHPFPPSSSHRHVTYRLMCILGSRTLGAVRASCC